ncbi:MAG: sulfatase [Planctomycetales bacterium]
MRFLVIFSAVCVSLAAVGYLRAAEAAAKRTNVLFIMADDLNNDLGCYGSKVVKSPQIDRLASHGVRFDRAYCNYPVCNCSRASMLSGRYTDRIGIVDNVTPPRKNLPDVVMLPEFFRKQRYVTRKVGKIFHTGDEFEDPRSWDIDIREDKTSKNPPKEQIVMEAGHVKILRASDEETWDGKVARTAVQWLEECAQGEQPFFIAAGFRRPHTPYISPEKYYQLYDAEKLIPEVGPAEHLTHIPDLALTYKFPKQERFPQVDPGKIMAAYYGSVSFMDAQLGLLLDALDRLKLWDSTVVVFVSDHGYHLGEHGGLYHKMTLFEEGVRVPLIIAAPGGARGQGARGLVELVDLYPTLCELTGQKGPDGLQGGSVAKQVAHPESDGKAQTLSVVSRGKNKTAVLQLDPKVMGRSLRTERWRYTLWPDGTQELYDHDVDPHEWTNLAVREESRATVEGLRQKLAEMVQGIGRP